MDMTLEDHYGLLLGMTGGWRVARVDLDLDHYRVSLSLEHDAGALCCPECGCECGMKDRSEERTWRHLDTMQFETILTARVPRVTCREHGVKQVLVPWAEPHGRFTLLFQAFAIRVLQSSANIQKACTLLRLNWKSAQDIMSRAVERGLAHRTTEGAAYLSLDEKSFRRGQDYVTVLTDNIDERVLEVAPGRDESAATTVLETLPPAQRDETRAVGIDMSAAYAKSIETMLPNAEIVYDKFHVVKLLSQAVDNVRKLENTKLAAEGNGMLKGTKYLWLWSPTELNSEQWDQLDSLRRAKLKTGKAWILLQEFREFWTYHSAAWAEKYFDRWYSWAVRCRLAPMVKAAKTLKRHLSGLLSWFRHPIDNGRAEGFNSLIQSLKSAARGFRNFHNYRVRILFFLGKLDLLPKTGT